MWKQFWNSQGKMHMYEYLLFELKSEHVFSMPGFKHVAMEKKYTQYLLFDLKSEWVSQELWHTGRRSTSSSKNSCQGKEGLFFQGTVGTRQIGKFWQKRRNLSYDGLKHNADSPADEPIPT
jgi:heme-degrading monooxygenase HmoA